VCSVSRVESPSIAATPDVRVLSPRDCTTEPFDFAASPVWAAGGESRRREGGRAALTQSPPAGATNRMSAVAPTARTAPTAGAPATAAPTEPERSAIGTVGGERHGWGGGAKTSPSLPAGGKGHAGATAR